MIPIIPYWRLTRPRIVAMVLFSMAVTIWVAGEGTPLMRDAVHALVGAAFVIAGSVALNQRLESGRDAMMARTCARPVPSGQLTEAQVTRFGLLLSAVGFAYLAAFSSLSLVALAAVSWTLYVWAYTPLKSRSVWQTPVGALAGAMPILLGAAAAGAPLSPMALVLFGLLFFWQFPHSMAIAWLYRDQFGAAGMRLTTVVDPSGRTAGVLAVAGSMAVLLVSLIPWMCSWTTWQYQLTALLLGHGYLGASFVLLHQRNNKAAQWLLRMSLIYLPFLLAALLAFRKP